MNILTQEIVYQMMGENPSMKEHFIIPEGVTEIGSSAFSGCTELESITIPNSVTKIEEDAFAWCRSLQSIIIPDSVTEIGDRVFDGCNNLKEITAPEHLTQALNKEFANYKWQQPNLKIVKINSSNPSISEEKKQKQAQIKNQKTSGTRPKRIKRHR